MLCAVETCTKGKVATFGPIKNRLLICNINWQCGPDLSPLRLSLNRTEFYVCSWQLPTVPKCKKMYRGAVSLKGFQRMGNGRNSIKIRSQLFNDDLSNDTASDQIDLHEQYL